MPSVDRDDRRGQERQAGRPQRQEAERQARLDRRPTLRGQRIEVVARLRRPTARSTRRRGPRPRPSPRPSGPRTADRRPADARPAPDRDVAPLVVAVARLRADVRCRSARRRDRSARSRPAGRVEPAPSGRVIDPGVDRDAHRIPVVVDPGEDLVRVASRASRARSRRSSSGVLRITRPPRRRGSRPERSPASRRTSRRPAAA